MRILTMWEAERREPVGVPGSGTPNPKRMPDIMINEDRVQERLALEQTVEEASEKLFANMSFRTQKSKRILLTLLWFSALPCDKLLVHCVWRGRDIPCGHIFKVIPTDVGFCCSFNHLDLTDMLRNSAYAQTIEAIETNHVGRVDAGTVRYSGGGSGGDPGGGDDGLDLNMSPKEGKQNGLTVVMDLASSIPSPSSISQDFLGVQAAVGPRDEVS